MRRRVAIAGALIVGLSITGLVLVGQTPADLNTAVLASGFTSPIAVVQDTTNRSVQFVVEQGGRIRVVRDGTVLGTDFLNLSGSIAAGGERGLLGMALAPNYASSGRFYMNFTNTSGHTIVARFRRSPDPLVADPDSRFDLRWNGAGSPPQIDQPYSNHNGGHLAFGPDGYLYVGLGDGGSGNDPENRAQTPGTLLGKMLRVDVNVQDGHPVGYTVPASNPFLSGGPAGTRPEIWAFGLRNPWRYSFDDPALGGTGALFVGDVGQGGWEEIDYEPAGAGGRNYGWRNREGAHDNVTSVAPAYTPLIDPIHEYARSVGQSVTGGYVYRGSRLPSRFRGRYFFADFVRGRVWSFTVVEGGGDAQAQNLQEHTATLGAAQPLGTISSFGLDADGELLIVAYGRGAVLRVVSVAAPRPPENVRIVR